VDTEILEITAAADNIKGYFKIAKTLWGVKSILIQYEELCTAILRMLAPRGA